MWRDGLRSSLSVAAPFVWRCLNSRTITPFPQSAQATALSGGYIEGRHRSRLACTAATNRAASARRGRASSKSEPRTEGSRDEQEEAGILLRCEPSREFEDRSKSKTC